MKRNGNSNENSLPASNGKRSEPPLAPDVSVNRKAKKETLPDYEARKKHIRAALLSQESEQYRYSGYPIYNKSDYLLAKEIVENLEKKQ